MHNAEFIDATSIATVSARSLAKFAVGAPLIFWKAELADRKAECCFLACVWRSTPQLPSQRIRT
jgi:hypothetical protein